MRNKESRGLARGYVNAIYPGRIQFNLDYDKEKDSFKRMVALITELKRDYNIYVLNITIIFLL